MLRISLFFIGLCLLLFLTFTAFLELSDTSRVTSTSAKTDLSYTLFPYQCIDTMKISRDKARLMHTDKEEASIIEQQVQTIASLGANCIAISTPYDDEFIPYLTEWVQASRKAGLSIWFRGNWSSWEGWYGYPKNQTTDEHIEANIRFITAHPDLFMDGDIFSPNTEPEHGNPFNPIDTPEKHALMQSYLLKEQSAVKNAFAKIGKRVDTSWVSLSGGVAKMIVDKNIVSALNNTVTLDHYVENPQGLTEYLTLFHDTYGANIVFGEFGAPIPDINGKFTNKQQAEFVDKLFKELYHSRKIIKGINYWTLTESSTALIDEHGDAKPVVDVLKKYYLPGTVTIKVTDKADKPVKNAVVSVKSDQTISVKTDDLGTAFFILPQGTYAFSITHPEGNRLKKRVELHGKEAETLQAKFTYPTSGFRTMLTILGFSS